MRFPEVEYLRWAKALRSAKFNLARSGVAHCPPALLAVRPRDWAIELPVGYGYQPLRAAIASRYGVQPDQVLTVSGGTTFANWFACATALDGASADCEAIVERPTYEPLLRLVEGFGCRVKRLDRREESSNQVDLDRFHSLVTPRTKLAIVTNLHNPSGARIDADMLRRMSRILASVKAWLLVDEVYLESLFHTKVASCVHAGPNVLVTNSLTKAYGLDGLRAGWMLGPASLVRRAWEIHTLIAGNGVAAGELLTLRAFERLRAISARAHRILDVNRRRIDRFFKAERRLTTVLPPGGNVLFASLPGRLTGDEFATHLFEKYSTLVVPGRFFEAPNHVRLSFGCLPDELAGGLERISRALDDLG